MADVLQELGARVRARRVAHGLTQQELADACGLTRSSIANLEAGNQRIHVDTLVVLASKLACLAGQLLGEIRMTSQERI